MCSPHPHVGCSAVLLLSITSGGLLSETLPCHGLRHDLGSSSSNRQIQSLRMAIGWHKIFSGGAPTATPSPRVFGPSHNSGHDMRGRHGESRALSSPPVYLGGIRIYIIISSLARLRIRLLLCWLWFLPPRAALTILGVYGQGRSDWVQELAETPWRVYVRDMSPSLAGDRSVATASTGRNICVSIG